VKRPFLYTAIDFLTPRRAPSEAPTNTALWIVNLVCLVVVGSWGVSPELRAAVLQRGPYLQVATQDSVIVRWRTDEPCESVVRYGTQIDVLTASQSDSNSTTNHAVRLTDLVPATQYFYSIGSHAETLAEGAGCNFITSPPPGRATPTRVWAIGDPGQSWSLDQRFVRDAYYKYAGPRHTDVWLALGDNACTLNTDQEYQTFLFDVYADLFRQTALWPTIGNHEVWSATADGWFPYLDIFSCPTNGEAGGIPSGTKNYYSFDYANIHFICLDSVTESRATNGPMANWLRADLAATTNQWIISYWHHPPYSCGTHWSDSPYEVEMIEMRQNLMPILEMGGVDLVLNGHSHDYERSYLLHGHYGTSTTLQPGMILDEGSGRESDTGAYIKPTSGPLANQGTVYVEVGCSASVDDPDMNCHHPVIFFQERHLGSLVLDINSNRLDAAFLRETGEVHDSFTILKGEPAQFRLCSFILKGGTTILRWKSVPGQTYRIEFTDNPQISDWRPASEPFPAVGYTTSWTNVMTSGPIHLFRVVKLPPSETAQPTAGVPTSASLGIAGWHGQVQDFLTALDDERSRDQLPIRPDRRCPLAVAGLGEAVICNTTYWKRWIRPQTQHSTSPWRLASNLSKGIWRQSALPG
jgi:hypothetical protein